jgi:hypothetical protein
MSADGLIADSAASLADFSLGPGADIHELRSKLQ